MKQLAIRLFILISLLICLFPSLGVAQVGTLRMALTVKPVFQMSISQSTIDFGSVDISSPQWKWDWLKDQNTMQHLPIAITCRTNLSQQWRITIEGLTDLFNAQDGVSFIPLSNMKWMCVYAYNQNGQSLSYQTSLVNFSQIASTVYSSAAQPNLSLNGTKTFQMMYMLEVPKTIRSGDYSTTVRLTMTTD